MLRVSSLAYKKPRHAVEPDFPDARFQVRLVVRRDCRHNFKVFGRLVVYDVQNVVYGYYADNSVFAVNDRQRNKVVFSDCVGRFLLRRMRVYRNYADGHNFVYFCVGLRQEQILD